MHKMKNFYKVKIASLHLRLFFVVFFFQGVRFLLPKRPFLLHRFHVFMDKRNQMAERKRRLCHVLYQNSQLLKLVCPAKFFGIYVLGNQ